MTNREVGKMDVEATTELLRALAHAVRLVLLRALVGGERSVSEIETVTGVAQPGLSQQLAILRKAGVVLTRREAKQIFYRIDKERFAELGALLDSFAGTVSVPQEQAATRMTSGGAAMFARVQSARDE